MALILTVLSSQLSHSLLRVTCCVGSDWWRTRCPSWACAWSWETACPPSRSWSAGWASQSRPCSSPPPSSSPIRKATPSFPSPTRYRIQQSYVLFRSVFRIRTGLFVAPNLIRAYGIDHPRSKKFHISSSLFPIFYLLYHIVKLFSIYHVVRIRTHIAGSRRNISMRIHV